MKLFQTYLHVRQLFSKLVISKITLTIESVTIFKANSITEHNIYKYIS